MTKNSDNSAYCSKPAVARIAATSKRGWKYNLKRDAIQGRYNSSGILSREVSHAHPSGSRSPCIPRLSITDPLLPVRSYRCSEIGKPRLSCRRGRDAISLAFRGIITPRVHGAILLERASLRSKTEAASRWSRRIPAAVDSAIRLSAPSRRVCFSFRDERYDGREREKRADEAFY